MNSCKLTNFPRIKKVVTYIFYLVTANSIMTIKATFIIVLKFKIRISYDKTSLNVYFIISWYSERIIFLNTVPFNLVIIKKKKPSYRLFFSTAVFAVFT